MRASELRIGNLVTLSEETRKELWDNQITAHNNYFKVEVIYSDGDIVLELDDESVDVPDKDILGIPLTEDWLLKMGFQFPENEVEGEIIINRESRFSAIRAKGFYSVGLSGSFGLFLVKVKYVHSLQNLYYSVFEEELTLKN